MIRLALISDIHGNCAALDAVLADATARGVGEVVCRGEVAAGGPQPREVIRRLRQVGCAVSAATPTAGCSRACRRVTARRCGDAARRSPGHANSSRPTTSTIWLRSRRR
jgi:hypothetical protein